MINHQNDLLKSYDKVFDLFLNSKLFDQSKLKQSQKIFNLKNNKISTKKFDVYALVSGLKFSLNLQKKVINLQKKINEVIGDKKRYWVKPKNLAVEYIVIKWPEDLFPLESNQIKFIKYLDKIEIKPFNLEIRGFQIHTDGCVVLRGFDNNNILSIRKKILKKFKWLPKKQSSWAHIPIGRILENIKPYHFQKLKKLINETNLSFEFDEKITNIKYVYEKQWYMENIEVIFEKKLLSKYVF